MALPNITFQKFGIALNVATGFLQQICIGKPDIFPFFFVGVCSSGQGVLAFASFRAPHSQRRTVKQAWTAAFAAVGGRA